MILAQIIKSIFEIALVGAFIFLLSTLLLRLSRCQKNEKQSRPLF